MYTTEAQTPGGAAGEATRETPSEHLARLLADETLSPRLRAGLETLAKAVERERRRVTFRVDRMAKDKEIAQRLLAKTIEDLESNVRELRAAHDEMEAFMYVASHDLKTPLRSIAGFANLITRRHGAELPAGASEYFGYIREGATAMNRVIADLLEYNRAGIAAQAESLTLAEVLDEVRLSLHSDLAASGAELVLARDAALRSPRSALTQLLQNLIGNAVVHRHPERDCRVEVGIEEADGHLVLYVLDNGPGIADSDRERVFMPFRRGGDCSREGSGMGLTICKRLARQVGGSIDFRSEPGAWTRFEVRGLAAA